MNCSSISYFVRFTLMNNRTLNIVVLTKRKKLYTSCKIVGNEEFTTYI